MNAPSRSVPPAGEPSVALDWLTPQPWRLQDEPPPAAALNRPLETHAAPLLLRIDRYEPLPADWGERLAATLSPEERHRHAAYRLPADREHFLLGRGGLRRLLGSWLDLAPAAVPLETDAHGKPHCPGGPAFNISHSGELILLALHASRPVGVDVERLRPALDWQAVARRMLPVSEWQALEALPEGERAEAFLAAWCRLEARLKARGTGLAGLERLRRQTDGASPNSAVAQGEQLWDVAVPAGYRAAVALAPRAPQGPGGSGGSSLSIRSSGVSG